MKLLLTSTGFANTAITQAFESLVGKTADTISVAVINEAYAVEHDDHTWVIDELSRIRQTVGSTVEIVSLLANSIDVVRERIMQHDALFVIGGHTDYLMHVYETTGFAALLPTLLETKVYIGSSAGSMVVCNRISSQAYLDIYGEGDDYGVETYMGLVDTAIKPHLNSPYFPNNREESLVHISQTYPCDMYALSDTSALVVDGANQQLVGYDWLHIQHGKVITRG